MCQADIGALRAIKAMRYASMPTRIRDVRRLIPRTTNRANSTLSLLEPGSGRNSYVKPVRDRSEMR